MNRLKFFWPLALILVVVCAFFYPIFKGNIPFPGDILVNDNPYSSQSFLGYSPGGYPNKAQGPDVTKEIYPWRYFSINEIKSGNLPFWNPHNFSGNPQMANFQTGIFYPFNLLYFIFSFNLAWTLIIMLQPFLAAVFMYYFLRKSLSLSNIPSIVGGIAFGFSSYMSVWMEYGNIGSTLLWLPLALLFAKKMYEEKNLSLNFLILTLIYTISILAGYIQGVFYIYVISFLYFFFQVFLKRDKIAYKKILFFFLSLLFPLALSFFQVFPTLLLFSNSTRGAYSLEQISKMLAPVYYWITAFVPDFFGNPATRNYWYSGTYIETVMYAGVGIIFFAFYAALKSRVSEVKFFTGLAALSLIIASNIPGIKFFYLLPIPMISTTVPTREFNVLIFSLVILSAIGIEHWIKEKDYKTKITFFFALIYFLIWGAVFFLTKILGIDPVNISVAKRNLIIPTFFAFSTIAIFYIKFKNAKLSYFLLIILVCADLFYFFNKITPFSPSELTYPSTPIISHLQKTAGIGRYWGYGSAYISPDYQSVDKTYSPEGNDPLHIVSYGELMASSKTGQLPLVLPRPDANIAPGYGVDDLKNNIYRKRVLDLLGVKYILNKQDVKDVWEQPDLNTFSQDQYELVYKEYPWQVYENKSSLPRFFLASDYRVENHGDILDSIYDSNIDLKKTILLEEKPDINIDKNSVGEVNLLSYNSNQVKFSTSSSGNSILFLSDNYYPEWKVKVDGVNTKLLRADYTFRAVVIPSGKHNVEFYYDPVSFVRGLAVSAVSLGFLLIIFFTTRLYEKKK
ncbi:YfhO family protein [Patescibacteria group bacterium]|nr:YfhO family protein [Patescibacteria group bacterium]